MKRLILLRHGETDWNAAHRIQGQLNSELNQVGLAQARAVAPRIAAMMPSLLWASDLDRAAVTAAIVGEACGLSHKPDARLREYELGSLQGMTHDEFRAQDPEGFAIFRKAQWSELDEIESPDDVAKRFVACLSDLVDSLDSDEVGVAVAHGAAIRTAVVAWLGWPLESARDFRALGNCAWVEIDQSESGVWTLGAYNRTAE